MTVPAADGLSYQPSQVSPTPCEPFAVLDFNYVENTLAPAILANAAVKGSAGTTTMPIFLTYNVVIGDPGTSPFANCCVLGFHSSFQKQGQGPQFYGISEWDSTGIFLPDISILTHEIGELLNDPVVTNATPSWRGGQVKFPNCQNNFEVGDPLTGTFFPSITMNSFTYHPQELVFSSWFFRQSPSLGVNGWYSDNGTFTSGAGGICVQGQ